MIWKYTDKLLRTEKRFSHDIITFKNIPRKAENGHHVGVQDATSMVNAKTPTMLLVCVEAGDIPPPVS